MKITFIKPSMIDAHGGDSLEPLVFGILAGLTPREIDLRLYDERIEAIDFEQPADLVAITCDTYSARRSYQIAAAYRRRGVPVVMGGCHPTLETGEALQYVETVVAGDAEDTWPAVISDARDGRLQRLYRSQNPPLDCLMVDRSIFAGKRYGPMRLVQWGRGCCHGCDFCSIHALYGNQLRYRPLDAVIDEITALREKSIIFTDDNLIASKPLAMELMRRLKPLKIHWACQATLDAAEDPELLALMAASGCLAVMVGLESLRDDNLMQMRKARRQSSARYAALVGKIHAAGMMVYGSLIFGYDHDTPCDFAPSLDFAVRQKLFLANFNPLIPMPGTPLYERLRAEGRLLYDPWWLDPAFRYGEAAFRPLGMSPEELTHGVLETRRKFNRLSSIAWRGLNLSANMRTVRNAGAYLAVNFINRREIYRKQGMPLGRPDALEPMQAVPAC